MRNLLQLLIHHGVTILFFSLEIVCFILIVRFNQKQNQIWISSANRISGMIYEQSAYLSDFLSLRKENRKLQTENARLRAMLKESRYDARIVQDSVKNDSLQQQYVYIGAKIINNSVNQNHNMLTIDRGTVHGIAPHMGVISPEGIVGIVQSAGSYYSTVMSILNRQSRISAEIARIGYFGSLVWEGGDPMLAKLQDIPKHAEPRIGDTVQTSGYSQIFPNSIPIGVIENFVLPEGDNFFRIDVKLINDLSKAKYVYVVNNLIKKNLEESDQPATNEQ